MNVPQFKTTRVELNGDTPTVAPLELQHLGLGEEYKRVVAQTVEDIQEAKKRAVCMIFLPLLVVGVAIGVVMGAVAPSNPGPIVGMMFGSFALLVLGMCAASQQGRQALKDAKARCEEVNQSPNVVGRAQFTIDSESHTSHSHNGKRHTHTTCFLNIEYSPACLDPAMQPVAIPMGLPVSGYPQHGPTPTAPPLAGYNPPCVAGAPAFKQPAESII